MEYGQQQQQQQTAKSKPKKIAADVQSTFPQPSLFSF